MIRGKSTSLKNCTPLNTTHPYIKPLHHYDNVHSLKWIRNHIIYLVDFFSTHLTKLYALRGFSGGLTLHNSSLTFWLSFASIVVKVGPNDETMDVLTIDMFINASISSSFGKSFWSWLLGSSGAFSHVGKLASHASGLTFNVGEMWLSSFSEFYPRDWPFFLTN